MSDSNPNPTAARDCNADGAILLLLTAREEQRPWSVEEVISEYGEHGDAIDALNRLQGAGLIHRTSDGFVWATRAAIRSDEISI